MNEKRNFDYKRLHPFKWYILENFPFLEDSIDVLTNYQLFCKLGEMYNKEVDAINTLGVQVEGITDWFDNLDVQDEVNKKLDEMAESGELEEIIATYINTNALICFDNVADMKSAENLVNGSFAKTLGYYSKNDGGMGTYKIRNITNDDVIDEGHIIELSDNNLIAELITDKVNVKQFGAKGDNSTDDLQAFQNAIDYVNENGTLYVPKGVYKISSTINTKSSISIIGEDDVPKIIFTGTGVLFNITGHPNIDYEYETKPRDTSSELKPILKQLFISTGELHGKGKANTTAINFNTTNDTIMARGFIDNIHILHFDIGINIGKYHFYLMNFRRLNLTMNNTGIKTNNDRVDSGEKISITDCLFDTNKVGIEFTGADYDMNILNTSIDFNKCFIYASGNVIDDSRKIVIDGCHYETNDDDYVFSSDEPHGFLFGILQGTSIFITNSKFSTRSADTLFFANGRSGGTYIHFDNNRLEFKAGYYNDVQVVPYLYYFNQDENFIVTAKNNDSVVFTKPLSFRQAINSVPGIAYPYANGTATKNNQNLIVDSANQVTNVYISPDGLVNVGGYNITAKNSKTGYKGLQFIPTDNTQAVQVIVSEGSMTEFNFNETKRVCMATTNCSKVEYQIAYFDENKARTHTDTYYTALENNTIQDETLIIPHCPAVNKGNSYTRDKYFKVYARLTGIIGKNPELNALVVYTT